ncbi:hypothetical protein D8911_00895 [Levilactobacillus brevis]|nr:hypothetical protein D8911_00895 [Levilactobacillus brevis]
MRVSFSDQLSVYLIVAVILSAWLGEFLTAHKNQATSYKVAWLLKTVALVMTVVCFLAACLGQLV